MRTLTKDWNYDLGEVLLGSLLRGSFGGECISKAFIDGGLLD